jgi:hypothetical protein
MKNEKTERIESLIDLSALAWFNTAANTIVVDMLNEGWEYSDAREYLFDKIDEIIEAHKRQDRLENKFSSLIGKKCIVIDEVIRKNNVTIHTISGVGENGGLCFEDYNGETIFCFEYDEDLFVEGYKAWIHPNEVSIQLID